MKKRTGCEWRCEADCTAKCGVGGGQREWKQWAQGMSWVSMAGCRMHVQGEALSCCCTWEDGGNERKERERNGE